LSVKPLFDLHTHTIASGHAFSTLLENLTEAKKKGLIALGTSDHSPGMPWGTNKMFFENYKILPSQVDGVRLLKGMEANIIDYEGNIDGGIIMEEMDYVIVSLHSHCIHAGTREENTSAVLGAMQHSPVRILGHLDDGRYPLDYDAIAESALKYGVAIEINDSSLRPSTARKDCVHLVHVLAETAKKYKVPVVLNSDAHIWCNVGRLDAAEQVLKEVDYPEELILNYSEQGLQWILGKK